MAQNQQIQAKLSAEAKEQIIRRIDEIRAYLPFLVNLDNRERMKIRKMGPKSLGYVRDCEAVARTFPEIFPLNLDADQMQRDISLHQDLADLKIRITALLAGVDDTMMAAGSDAMIRADGIYDHLKRASAKETGYKDITEQIAKRFKRSPRASRHGATVSETKRPS